MNFISKTLRNIDSRCALIPFITAGYPNISSTIEALYILDSKGADIIELGIPYSDALADGPIIQKASRIALEQGIYVDQVFDIVKKVSPQLHAPIIIFTYYNPILVRGISCFIQDLFECGAKGLIIPDLPLEETDTGIRNEIEGRIDQLAVEIKEKTNKLLILGFGISTVEHAFKISKWNIDGIVMGTAFIKMMRYQVNGTGLNNLGVFCEQVKKAIKI